MTKPKFTTGPWKVGKGYEMESGIDGWTYYPIYWSEDGECVCDTVYKKADAQLIAAAPEMYAMLDFIRAVLVAREDGSAERIEKVLRKARGESEVEE